jgi:hypothetical protein
VSLLQHPLYDRSNYHTKRSDDGAQASQGSHHSAIVEDWACGHSQPSGELCRGKNETGLRLRTLKAVAETVTYAEKLSEEGDSHIDQSLVGLSPSSRPVVAYDDWHLPTPSPINPNVDHANLFEPKPLTFHSMCCRHNRRSTQQEISLQAENAANTSDSQGRRRPSGCCIIAWAWAWPSGAGGWAGQCGRGEFSQGRARGRWLEWSRQCQPGPTAIARRRSSPADQRQRRALARSAGCDSRALPSRKEPSKPGGASDPCLESKGMTRMMATFFPTFELFPTFL